MTIFDKEEHTIQQAQAVLDNDRYRGNPLLQPYDRLLDDYKRMYKQLRHVVNVSDSQQARLNDLNHKLEASNASKDKFFSIIAHDLRGPLASLIGLSEVLQEQIDADVSKQTLGQSVDVMYNSTKDLYALLENLLTWSRIQRGAIESCPENLDLTDISRFIIRLFWSQAQQKQIQFLNTVADDLMVYADYNMVSTVLRNLVSNAIKFTPPGGTIEISAENSDETCVEVAVSDTGVGIPEDEILKLFRIDEEYTKLGTAGERGTGLGLNLCQEFVEKANQRIWVNSEVGKGTTFRFTLPQGHVEQDSAAQSQVATLDTSSLSHYRMLVVDDVPANRQYLINLLEPFGFRFREANNGQEAIDIWAHWQPHLIWMDIRMPVMNGYDAAKQIKASINGKSTAIIALTASIAEEEYATAFAVGYDNLLRKPFNETDIFNMIQCYLGISLNLERRKPGNVVPEEKAAQDSLETVLTPEAIAALPQAWRDDLFYVARVFELNLATQVIERMRDQNPSLANALSALIHNYEFERLRELCEEAGTLDDKHLGP